MDTSDNQYGDELAWLRLVYTKGIGPKKAWKIYNRLRESSINLPEVFSGKYPGFREIMGISDVLKVRLQESDLCVAEERFNYLQRSSLRLLHPNSEDFPVPEIPGLPPTLTLWGDLSLLNAREIGVLMKSRDTSDEVLKIFLQKLAREKIPIRTWCFCPFSRLDWELVESLLKLDCGLILGLVSGISRKAVTLAHEISSGRMMALAPEPPLRSRGALFACIEAFYRLFCTLNRKVFVIQARPGGKTAKRVIWAKDLGCEIAELRVTQRQTGGEGVLPVHKRTIKSDQIEREKPPDNDEDDGFISCL